MLSTSSLTSRARGSRDDVDDPAFLFEQVIFIYFPSFSRVFPEAEGAELDGRTLVDYQNSFDDSFGRLDNSRRRCDLRSNAARILFPVEV